MPLRHRFSGPVTVFHERPLPERATPAGYAALLDAFELQVPLPRTLCAIGTRHRVRDEAGWRLFTPRHAPAASLEGHLTFALKHEGLDLAVLKRLFTATGSAPIARLARAQPTGRYARRVWFLYEWLLGARLNVADAERGSYVPVVDPGRQWAGSPEISRRHRVRNNLPGTPAFCPMVFRTPALEAFAAMDLGSRARQAVAEIPKDVLSRTAAFLLLKDSRASYAIEGERPPQSRIQRWGRAIGEAGRRPVTLEEIVRLQALVIGDDRFVRLGVREQGGFVGQHDRATRMPIPDHVSARAEDLPELIDGMAAFDRGPARAVDPVVAAAALAFGFVYVHPFEDGNGRIHRYLVHHVLAQRGFSPAGLVFPVSAAILDRLDDYRAVLEGHSQRLLPFIHWGPTADGNVRVLNETGDLYRFFDATPHAEFLYACVRQTIEVDLPREAAFLARYDDFRARIKALVEMPERTIDLLFRFLQQHEGRLSTRVREHEFAGLTDREAAEVEAAYREVFTD